MDLSAVGRLIIVVGVLLVVVGGLVWIAARMGVPLGRLPGDIRIEREGFSCYAPIVSMILLSALLTLLLNIIIRLINR